MPAEGGLMGKNPLELRRLKQQQAGTLGEMSSENKKAWQDVKNVS